MVNKIIDINHKYVASHENPCKNTNNVKMMLNYHSRCAFHIKVAILLRIIHDVYSILKGATQYD